MNKIIARENKEYPLLYWILFISGVIVSIELIKDIFNYDIEGIPVTRIIAGIGSVFIVIFYGSRFVRWVIGCYFKVSPFVLKLSEEQAHSKPFLRQKFLSKKIVIKSHYDGKYNLFPSGFNLNIKTRRLKTFEQVNIRLEERQWFKSSRLWCWVNTPEDIVSIKEVIDLDIQNTEIHNRYKADLPKDSIKTFSDGKGGIDIQYNPPYKCPKGGFLSLKIKLDTSKVKGQWKGRVNFKHIRGDDYQSYAYMPIKISQQQVADTLNF